MKNIRRAPLKRTPLRPSLKRIERRTELPRSQKPIKPGRRHRKCYDHLRDEPFKEWARETYPCEVVGKEILPGVVHRCAGVLEFAHITNEGVGGSDRGNGIILCTEAHTGALWSWHRDGRESFQRRFGIDAPAIAQRMADQYEVEFPQDREAGA